MEACEVPNEASDMCLCTEPSSMSDGAVSAENGGELVAASDSKKSKRATPITAAQKSKLLELFKRSFDGWRSTSLPRVGVDQELDRLLKELGLSRSQAGRQLLHFKQASHPELVGIHVDSDASSIKVNIINRLGGVESVVDAALESFAESNFCVSDDFRGKYFADCRDAARKHVVALVEALVQAAAESSARSVAAADRMVKKFAEQRLALFWARREQFLLDTDLCQVVCEKVCNFVPSPLRPHEPALLFAFLEQQCFETFSDMLADHGRPELSPPDSLPDPDYTDRRAGLLYYLAGWLCFKVKRTLDNKARQDDESTAFWRRWFGRNAIGPDEAQEQGLPTALTDERVCARMLQYGGLEQRIEYALPALFAFVCGVEVTYSRLLTTANLLAYGDGLIVKIHAALVAHEPTMRLFRATLPDGALDAMTVPHTRPRSPATF